MSAMGENVGGKTNISKYIVVCFLSNNRPNL